MLKVNKTVETSIRFGRIDISDVISFIFHPDNIEKIWGKEIEDKKIK